VCCKSSFNLQKAIQTLKENFGLLKYQKRKHNKIGAYITSGGKKTWAFVSNLDFEEPSDKLKEKVIVKVSILCYQLGKCLKFLL